jgi:autotransporter-associated beta strand protein
VPNGVGATASFSGNITAQSTVTLDFPVTLGTINFNSSLSYTIAGASSLVLQTSGGNASVNVLSGSHTIAAGVSVVMATPTVFQVSNSTDSLTVGGSISGANPLTKDGLGTLILQGSNTYAGTTTVAGGTLQLVGTSIATPVAWNPVLNLAGADIQAGKMVFDYTDGTSPAPTILADLIVSYNGGANSWTTGKFTSSTALANGTTLGWIDNTEDWPIVSGSNVFPAHSVTVMATIPGDFNLSGSVTPADYLVWFANNGKGPTVPGWMAWAEGDANYDGAVTPADYLIWFANNGKSFDPGPIVGGSGAGAAVPEPGTLWLIAAGLIGLLAHAWRRRV